MDWIECRRSVDICGTTIVKAAHLVGMDTIFDAYMPTNTTMRQVRAEDKEEERMLDVITGQPAG